MKNNKNVRKDMSTEDVYNPDVEPKNDNENLIDKAAEEFAWILCQQLISNQEKGENDVE